jgi:GH24 family phage-related lysozyme (muramidase)
VRASVDEAFVRFSSLFEGVVRSMYTDILGLVTVAIGDLIDPIEAALGLPFVHADGTPASRDEIAAAWHAVKNDKNGPRLGWRYTATLTTIRLTDAGVLEVVERKLQQNEADLRRRFPDFENWPADAQLATHSMAWACGAGFRFPRLAAALQARDFELAAKECHIDTDGPDHIPNTGDDNNGVKPRNAANVVLYMNAARVQAWKLDPDELHYPNALTDLTAEASTPEAAERARADAEEITGSGPIIHPLSYDVDIDGNPKG